MNILRTSFIYQKNYFRLETLTNVKGCPTFLHAESHDIDNNVTLPPFLNIVKDVSRDEEYKTRRVAMKDYQLRY